MRELIVDIETEGLENPKKLWVTVFRDVSNPEKPIVFRNLHLPHNHPKFHDFIHKEPTLLIGHNLIQFDLPVLERLVGYYHDPKFVVDTLVISRLLTYNIAHGHSLEAWGVRLNTPKSSFNDYSRYSPELEKYCIQDTLVTLKLYEYLKPWVSNPQWKESLRIEHDSAYNCRKMTENGFNFDIQGATELHEKISQELKTLDSELELSFPPKPTLLRVVTPKRTSKGAISLLSIPKSVFPDLSVLSENVPFSFFTMEVFNPGSPKQIVERLSEAGWKPTEKTKGHIQCERDLRRERDPNKRKILQEKLENYKVYGWKVSEENLQTLPPDAPEAARKLVRRLLLASRKSTLEEWLQAYNPSTGCIHGNFNHIGAWTHRKSHNGPNVANIPSGGTPYAHEMRSFWIAPKGALLVGVDADSIQLRILAHYMNDEAFTKALLEGKKEDGTDAHTMNMRALGPICKSRDDAKTFIYAWLLGAGFEKIAQILRCTIKEAKEACNNFLQAYPGLKKLKEEKIPQDTANGYFEAIDGRLILCNNSHLMLAGYLQSGESIAMKKANQIWLTELDKRSIKYKQVNDVHDEWQTIVADDMELAVEVAKIQAEALRITGEYFNLNCPLAGSFIDGKGNYTIGKNWSQTH